MNILNDKGWTISFRIFFLIVIAIIGGRMLSWLIFFNPEIICLPYYLKNLTLIVCLLGGFTGYLIRNVNFFFINKSLVYYNFSFFSGSMWFIPLISTVGVVKWPLILGIYSYKMFDQGWSEYFGGQILYNQLKIYSLYVQEFQNNNLKIYLLSYILWVIILVRIILFLN